MVEEKKRGMKLQMIRYDVSGGGDMLRKENSISRFIFKQKKLSLLLMPLLLFIKHLDIIKKYERSV